MGGGRLLGREAKAGWWAVNMGPVDVISIVVRLFLEVTPISTGSGSHMPIILILHLIMAMHNVVFYHSEEQTAALAPFFTLKMRGAKRVADMAIWLSGALLVSASPLDVRDRITVSW